jgi:hypothetical protein
MPEPLHIDRIPDDHNSVPNTLAPSLWVRGLIATGIAAALNTVVFHIASADRANTIVAMARTEMVVRIAPVLAPTAFALALAGAVTWLVAPRGPPCGRGLRGRSRSRGRDRRRSDLHRAADGDRIVTRDQAHIIAGAAWFAALTIRTKN